MFHELRLSLEHFAYSPKCPSFLKGIIYKVNTKICWNKCFVHSTTDKNVFFIFQNVLREYTLVNPNRTF